jgi:hypothetical protein
MSDSLFYAAGAFAASAPLLAIVVIILHYHLRRAAFRQARRSGKPQPAFRPSSSSFGMAFQIVQVFYRPTVAYVIEAKLKEDAEDDDEGDPETPAKHLHRQLRRIRRGDPVDTLVLRL